MVNWLLKFRDTSSILCESIAKVVKLLGNEYQYWAAYRVIIQCILVGLEKFPEVRPIKIE